LSSNSGISVSLYLGRIYPTAAPQMIAEALQNIEVTHSDDGPGVFQMTFHADRAQGFTADFPLLSSPLLKPTNRVIISVTMNGTPFVLMDGFITRQELAHSREFGASSLIVTGEDISVVMDLYESSSEYPGMGDAAIAAWVMIQPQYSILGLIPTIIPTLSSLITLPIERVPQQNATDRQYLKELAAPHGYVFYVKPGPALMTNIAYWGPPIRFGSVQNALTVDMGPGSNVERINFQYNALAPSLLHGWVQDNETEEDLPLLTLFSTRLPPMASEPALDFNQPFVRNRQYQDPRLGYMRGLDLAQSDTDVSTDQVVTAQGELDSLRYGSILEAPGLVDVRGSGHSYDGRYYVQSVTHTISRGVYKQAFTLTREGTGSLVSEVNC